MRLILLLIGVAFVLIVSQCSSASDDAALGEIDESAPGIISATPTPEADPELQTTALPAEEEGVLTNRFDLDPGQCFNTYGTVSADGEVQPTTRVVACSRPHESEVYLQRNLPGGPEAPFPGETALRRAAEARCYGEFTEFTGAEYEQSELEIGVLHPTSETWSGVGLHREMTCYVYVANGGGLQGSMADSGI